MSRSERTVWACDEGIGSRLKEARRAAGISQRQLGFRGCSPAYLSRIESGDRWPSRQVIEELASQLHVSADWLAWGRGPRGRYNPRTDVRLLLDAVEPLPDCWVDGEHQAVERLRAWLVLE